MIDFISGFQISKFTYIYISSTLYFQSELRCLLD